MARSNVAELSDAELLDELAIEREKLFGLRFDLATGALENTAKLGQHKRQIARILTELRDREIAAAEAGKEA